MRSLAERFPIGKQFTSQSRTIGEGDFTLLTNITWTTGEIHTNQERMKKTPFGDRVLAGPCVLALVIGLAHRGPLGRVIYEDGVDVVALLGYDEVRFTNGLKPGDTITVHTQLAEARPSGKVPNRAILRLKEWATNQHGDVLLENRRSLLLEITE